MGLGQPKVRIFIELPTWLGDSVMASPAINLIRANFVNSQIVFFGSLTSCHLYAPLKECEQIVIDTSKNSSFRLIRLASKLRGLGKFDLAFSFRSSFSSSFGLAFLKAKDKFQFKPDKKHSMHQVLRYANFISKSLNISIDTTLLNLSLPFKSHIFCKASLGINPGASYGASKRWDVDKFASIAIALANKFDIFIFGAKSDIKLCNEIETILNQAGIKANNLAGKTSIADLCSMIAGLSLFITNDSGPMHIAAAFKIPTIAIFGSTKDDETSPFNNPNARTIKLDPPLKCMPCMKRVCPLNTYECMKKISPQMVLDKAKELIG